ncbi:hypothetical protein GCM10017044_07870 [Kordiimonas sediminis]|uniref:Uncharacterized protein n=1 Tax=Kordiimonas sediminis TaxID=1735581 RepID=A0A919E5W3_9PROT|nr:hypothetical protein [Kordiimonas sediminis]GHF16027.1 hypothetical protein GCM10017044_07870 [Kordiimonas sediminis]
MAMASLTSSLIARKGTARPSAPSSGFGKSLLPQDNIDKNDTKKASGLSSSNSFANIASFTDYARNKSEANLSEASFFNMKAPAEEKKPVIKTEQKAVPTLYHGRVKKTLRLEIKTHNELLQLAEKKGTSQQALMQKAVEDLLKP